MEYLSEAAFKRVHKVIQSLEQSEILFLSECKIPLRQVYDLQSKSVSECSEAMVARGALFGFNAESCTKGLGHSLVSRKGHCIQCDPAKVGFMRRNSDKGDIYLVGSLELSLLKIGTTTNSIQESIAALNSQQYAGAGDWEKLMVAREVPRIGEIEFKIHTKLAKHRVFGMYFETTDGERLESDELFSSSLATAINVFEATIPKGIKPAAVIKTVYQKYDFPDRIPKKVVVAETQEVVAEAQEVAEAQDEAS